jgi:hypothetical protein
MIIEIVLCRKSTDLSWDGEELKDRYSEPERGE